MGRRLATAVMFLAAGSVHVSFSTEFQIGFEQMPAGMKLRWTAADSILHAWFKSYEAMLEKLEEAYLSHALEEVLDGLAAELPALFEELADGPLRPSLLDADYYLAVGRSLFATSAVPTHFGQDALVAETLELVAGEQHMPFNLFGRLQRDPHHRFDFSQFKLRGHYEASLTLRRYFKAMMWCGRVDFPDRRESEGFLTARTGHRPGVA